MPRRILEGNVVSDKANKTVTVLVERRYMHPIYKKYIKKSDKFAAHDENNQFREGDRVRIIECRPISKSKRWTVVTDGDAPKPSGSRLPRQADDAQAAPKVAKPKKAAAPAAEKAEKKADEKESKKEKAAAKKPAKAKKNKE